MVFEKKAEKVFYEKYTDDRKKLKIQVSIKKELAEERNKIIAAFNNEFEGVKLNSSILINIAMNCFIQQLENLNEDEAIFYLRKKALEEADR